MGSAVANAAQSHGPAFARGLARHGDAPALSLPDGDIVTYRALAARVDALADELGPNKRLVAIEAAAVPEAIACYLAALACGHVAALLPAGEPETFASFQRRFQPEVLFRYRGGAWRLDRAAAGEVAPLHPDLALLLMTSGSTGHGKAVRLSARAVEANAGAIADYLGLAASDRGALVLPVHYSYGLSVLNSHLARGASVHLTDGSILDPGFIDGLRAARCTNLAGVPYSYELLERIGFRHADLPDLRFMTVAGGRLAPELVRRYHDHLAAGGRRFFVMYGQTEATARIAYVPPDRVGRNADRIGIAIPGGTLALEDEAGRPVERAETPGELVYRGPNVMMGYADGRADLARGHEVERLRTGDLAVRDAAGLYRIVGRRSRMSKVAGVRIGHDALEAALAAEGIDAAIVGDDRSILAVQASPHRLAHTRERLAAASGLTLRHVHAIAVPALPRLPTGKLDYERLRALLSANRPPDPEGVAAVFRQAFFPHPVGDRDSFTTLGGDSLRYVELSMALELRLGRVPDGWEQLSIGALSRLEPDRRPGRAVRTDLVIRALAILMVVVHHQTNWPIPAGATAMMLLIGYGLGRFQKDALVAGAVGRVFRPLLQVLIPYYLIVAAHAVVWQQVPWASVFLVGNLGFGDPGQHTLLPFLYWFVEAFVQLLVVWAAVFAIPPIRRLAARDAFLFGMLFLAVAVAARFVVPVVWELHGRRIFALPWLFYLAVFGWCAAVADSAGKRAALLAATALVMPLMAYDGGNWVGSWVRYPMQIGVIAALLYVPALRMPRAAAALVLPLAAAGYHIYLFHRFVPELLLAPFAADVSPVLFDVGAVAGGVAVGWLAWVVQRSATRWIADRRAVRLEAAQLRI